MEKQLKSYAEFFDIPMYKLEQLESEAGFIYITFCVVGNPDATLLVYAAAQSAISMELTVIETAILTQLTLSYLSVPINSYCAELNYTF